MVINEQLLNNYLAKLPYNNDDEISDVFFASIENEPEDVLIVYCERIIQFMNDNQLYININDNFEMDYFLFEKRIDDKIAKHYFEMIEKLSETDFFSCFDIEDKKMKELKNCIR